MTAASMTLFSEAGSRLDWVSEIACSRNTLNSSALSDDWANTQNEAAKLWISVSVSLSLVRPCWTSRARKPPTRAASPSASVLDAPGSAGATVVVALGSTTEAGVVAAGRVAAVDAVAPATVVVVPPASVVVSSPPRRRKALTPIASTARTAATPITSFLGPRPPSPADPAAMLGTPYRYGSSSWPRSGPGGPDGPGGGSWEPGPGGGRWAGSSK